MCVNDPWTIAVFIRAIGDIRLCASHVYERKLQNTSGFASATDCRRERPSLRLSVRDLSPSLPLSLLSYSPSLIRLAGADCATRNISLLARFSHRGIAGRERSMMWIKPPSPLRDGEKLARSVVLTFLWISSNGRRSGDRNFTASEFHRVSTAIYTRGLWMCGLVISRICLKTREFTWSVFNLMPSFASTCSDDKVLICPSLQKYGSKKRTRIQSVEYI